MTEGKHIRIKDIAEKAGCSIGTVDRVIHKRGKVSPEVRERIEAIMKELDYRPDLNARALASYAGPDPGIRERTGKRKDSASRTRALT